MRQGEHLVDKKGTYDVKFLTKNYTKAPMPHTHTWATAQKPHTLTIDSASSCRACCSQATDAALWKRRSKAAINGQFSTCRRCIECLLPSCFFETQPRLATSKRGQDFRFYRIFVPTSHMGGVFIVVLRHKGHKTPLHLQEH